MDRDRLRLSTEGTPLQAVFQRLVELDSNAYESARREIGEYLVTDARDNLSAQRLFDGSPMPQSKAAQGGTFRRRIRSGKRKGKLRRVTIAARKTLIDTARLRDSYTYELLQAGVAWGSSLVYARIHHAGGRAGRGHRVILPARPITGLGPRQAGRIGAYLLGEVRKAVEGRA